MLRIYVGNLSFQSTEDTLRDLFAQHGEVDNVAVITDRETGRSRGFGFIEMANDNEAHSAIEALNGQEYDGRTLTVNEARPRTPHTGGGGGQRREQW
ncbi:MAG: RNA-binding protein [Phycisphaerae bacterium]|nr:RNA-binding protein [Phycisphaerae bacterium]